MLAHLVIFSVSIAITQIDATTIIRDSGIPMNFKVVVMFNMNYPAIPKTTLIKLIFKTLIPLVSLV